MQQYVAALFTAWVKTPRQRILLGILQILLPWDNYILSVARIQLIK